MARSLSKGKIIEKGIRVNYKDLNTIEKIAEYINNTYSSQ